MLRAYGEGRTWLEQALETLKQRADFDQLVMRDLINYLVHEGRTIRVIYVHGHWLDVNSLQDLENAGSFTSQH